MDDTDAARRRLLERLFVAFNDHDSERVVECMTPDVVFFAAAGPDVHGKCFEGIAEVRAAFDRTFTDMRDVRWDCKKHAVFGDRGLSEWLLRGTNNEGRQIEVDGCDIFEFRGDLICKKNAFRKDRM